MIREHAIFGLVCGAVGWLAGLACGYGWATERMARYWQRGLDRNAEFLRKLRNPPDDAGPSLFDLPAEGGGVKPRPGPGDK